VPAFTPLLDLLGDIPDPRRGEGQLYKLRYLLLFAILSLVTGGNSYRSVETFIGIHRERLNAEFGLNWRRAPAHTSIRYALKGLDPAAVEMAFRRHAALLEAACAKPGQGSIALDGKTLRGSFDHFNDRSAAQILSAFATDTALVLAHVDIAEKSNEIPAAQALLAELGIHGDKIVTLDALHCQKKHFEVAEQANIGLIVQVKDNQPNLRARIEEISAATEPLGVDRSRGKGRNRDERRIVTVFDPTDKLADTDWHSHVAAIIRVEREVYTRNTKTGLLNYSAEIAFYIANKPVTAPRAAAAIRDHWRIETTSHYSRDVTLGEDRSRIRVNPGVFARLRSFGFNILKANRISTVSQDRYRAALAGIDKLLELVGVA
jgi:predicted transposase YbfD/YdcC